MPPIQLNRRRFLAGSAAAGWALSHGRSGEGADPSRPVRLGFVGLGNRGTALLRAALDLPDVEVVALADGEGKHLARAAGIVEKARGRRPEAVESIDRLLEREEVDAAVVALPCDLHAVSYEKAVAAGKHLYAEKPLGLSVEECDRLILAAAARPDLAFHVGFQRRSNPRYRDGVAAIRRGEIGPLLSAVGTWISSNGPLSGHAGWLGRRDRSGDWMVEQAVHVWDILHWLADAPPTHAYGSGRRGGIGPGPVDRDVTDDYQAILSWEGGFSASFTQSWVAPADEAFTGVGLRVVGERGGLDFASGSLTPRDRKVARQVVQPGVHPDTAMALSAFIAAVRDPGATLPPVGLIDAREATITGLMVRRAVDENRVVRRSEVVPTIIASG